MSKFQRLSRRQFLRGAGGAALSLPFLPSLAGRAEAQTANLPRRFVALATGHGGLRGARMHPAQSTLTQSLAYAGHQVRRGDLSLSVANAVASLSPVLSGNSGVFTSRLASKMNVLRGIDTPYYIAHSRGVHLGNMGQSSNVPRATIERPTIDQVMAYSSSFYPSVPKVRAVHVGHDTISFSRQNPSDPASPVQDNPATNSSFDVFGQIYTAPTGPAPRRPVVDVVLADYRRVRSGARISAQDRTRLDAHIARLADYESRLTVVQSCGAVTRPSADALDVARTSGFGTNPALQAQAWALYTDMAAIAFSCDTCRIFTFPVFDLFSDYLGADYHQEVAHRADKDAPQPDEAANLQSVFAQNIHATAQQRFFEGVYLNLISKLDAVDDGAGGSLLDSCLVAWTQESGIYTHDAVDSPIVLAGSAAGTLNTGSFCDYRNTSRPGSGGNPGPFPRWPTSATPEFSWFGLTFNQYFGTLLQAMGVPPSEYEETSYGGYGPMFTTDDYGDAAVCWPEAVRRAAHEMLPFLGK